MVLQEKLEMHYVHNVAGIEITTRRTDWKILHMLIMTPKAKEVYTYTNNLLQSVTATTILIMDG